MTLKALKRTLLYGTATILVSALAACDDYDSSPVEELGRITVSLDWERHLLSPEGKPTDLLIPLDPPAEEVSLTMEDLNGGGVHTWDSFSKFPQDDIYLTGPYMLTATWGNPGTEGYDIPAYTGETETAIVSDKRTDAVITMKAVHAFFNTSSTPSEDHSEMSLGPLEAHTPGGVFHTLTPAGSEPEGEYLCLNPGKTSILATIYPGQGRTPVRIEGLELSTISGALYTVSASLKPEGGGAVLTMSAGGKSKTTRLTQAMLEGRTPVLTPDWDTSLTYSISEGEYPVASFKATVTAGSRKLRAVNLSVTSASLTEVSGFPAEINLLSPTPEQKALLGKFGVTCTLTPEAGGETDLSGLISHLVYINDRTALSTLTLEAVDEDGISSPSAEARIMTLPVDIRVTVPEPSVMCVDRAKLHIVSGASNFASNLSIGVKTEDETEFTTVACEVEHHGNDAYDVRFPVPPGTGPVDVCVFYCEEERARVSVPRVMPEFEVKVDAYARYAMLKVEPADPALTEPITRQLLIRLNGQDAPLFARQPDKGLLTVIGLQPDTEYTFETTLFKGYDVPLTPKVAVTTEPARQLPNWDFEDHRPGPRYDHLASGGRYSQTTVEIFNWQHHTDISEEVPAGWANTNAKTFNKQSRNHNTWYMQPSVALTREFAFSGSYSVRLSTVAFDLDGEQIPDYAQTGRPYLDYSPIVPRISHKAAGKLFLGTYTFDYATMAENYDEGMAWNSRPSSLSGRYRFIPTDANRSASGLAKIEVTATVDGKETVIASDSRHLTLASDFTTFNIPLTYADFGVKATKIKVMFASSADIGTIEEETNAIATQPDPRTATSTGGQLWIDNITLGY